MKNKIILFFPLLLFAFEVSASSPPPIHWESQDLREIRVLTDFVLPRLEFSPQLGEKVILFGPCEFVFRKKDSTTLQCVKKELGGFWWKDQCFRDYPLSSIPWNPKKVIERCSNDATKMIFRDTLGNILKGMDFVSVFQGTQKIGTISMPFLAKNIDLKGRGLSFPVYLTEEGRIRQVRPVLRVQGTYGSSFFASLSEEFLSAPIFFPPSLRNGFFRARMLASGDLDKNGKEEVISILPPDPEGRLLLGAYEWDGKKMAKKWVLPPRPKNEEIIALSTGDADGNGLIELLVFLQIKKVLHPQNRNEVEYKVRSYEYVQ